MICNTKKIALSFSCFFVNKVIRYGTALIIMVLWRDLTNVISFLNLEVPGLTCPGRDSNSGLRRGMRALEKSHTDILLLAIQILFLRMSLRQFQLKLKLFQVDIDANGDEVKYTEVSWLDLIAKEAARLRQVKGIVQLFYISS